MSLPRAGKGQDSIDYRFQLTAEHALHNVEEFAMATHRRSEHLDLPKEDVSKIGLGSKTRRRPTRERAPSRPSGAQASPPCIGADVSDDNIHTAFIGKVTNAFVEFLVCVIDKKVRADFLRPPKFFSSARR